jgi:hypothetical protein
METYANLKKSWELLNFHFVKKRPICIFFYRPWTYLQIWFVHLFKKTQMPHIFTSLYPFYTDDMYSILYLRDKGVFDYLV